MFATVVEIAWDTCFPDRSAWIKVPAMFPVLLMQTLGDTGAVSKLCFLVLHVQNLD